MSGQSAGAVNTIALCADRLWTAEIERRAGPPLTDSFPELSVADAYRIQQANVERRLARGERVIGHKIGLTARAMQEMFGVHEPDFGHLLNSMTISEGAPLRLSELVDPQVEVEPAFVLARPLSGPGVTIADVIAATDHVCVSLEIIDSRILDWRIRLQDTVADNGSSARVILGNKKVAANAVTLDDLDTELEVDGRVVERGNTSAILGHPAAGIAWLANTIAQFGKSFEAGHIVLPGTCTRAFRLRGHREARGRISGLGEVSIQIEQS